MKYIIHGATGAQGAPLYTSSISQGKQAIAAVRDPKPDDNNAIAIDYASVESLAQAYADAECVFIHLPLGPETMRMEFAKNIAQAVAISKPKRVVVSTSGWKLGVEGDRSALPTLIHELEKTGVSLAIIAPLSLIHI